MSGIGGVIFWDGRPAAEALAASVMEPIRHRGPDGVRWEARGPAALGQACLALRREEVGRYGTAWSPDGTRAVVADASLYNREELAGRLGEGWWSAEPSDAASILAAYECWGEAAVELLDGDFAFAIWDAMNRRVFAARDAFGVRPFVYYWSPELFAFGSEPKQLLRSRLVAPEPDDETVAEHLLFRFGPSERTFLRGIARVQAGHVLVADAHGATQRRWWNPTGRERHGPASPEEMHAEFRALLKDAVRKRIGVDVPVASHLSGGVDSPSIVVLAAEIFRERAAPCPAFSTISQVYPGLDCDESEAIASVAARVPFPGHLVNPLGESLVDGLEDEIEALDSPFAFIQRGAAVAETRRLRELGAKVLLTGIGGDDLTEEWAYFYDLAARRRYLRLVRDAWTFRVASSWGFGEILRDSIRPSLPLGPLRPLRRRLRRPPRPPAWINPAFTTAAEILAGPAPQPAAVSSSRLQLQVFENLTAALLGRTLEAVEARAAASGFQVRYPFLDRPLAEFVLAIPSKARRPGGFRKSLLRRSMVADLPDQVVRLRRKVVVDSFIRRVIAEGTERLASLTFGSGAWPAGRYVAEQAAHAKFAAAASDQGLAAPDFWRVATLALWLRQVTSCERI